jgi:hypothetical protein
LEDFITSDHISVAQLDEEEEIDFSENEIDLMD